jgi:hypothetical protein
MQMGSAERYVRWADSSRRSQAAAYGHAFRTTITLIALASMLVGGGTADADEFAGVESVALRDTVGGGIHAFHAGDFDRAYDDLTNAIEAGTNDPRSYYFRGLAALKLGRTSEAEADFTAGADREVSTGSIRRVSQSLERVQGPDRLTLERFRARARLGALQRDREVYGRRYSTIEDAVDDVRRRRRPEAFRPEPLVRPGMPAAKTPTAAGAVEEVPTPAATAEPLATPSDTFEDEPAAEADDPINAESSLPERAENRLGERAVQDELLSTEEENTLGERAVQSEVEAAAEGR